MGELEDHLKKRKMPFRDHIYKKVAIDNTSAVGNPDGERPVNATSPHH